MPTKDEELVRFLEARDGPIGSRWRPHRGERDCSYRNVYPEGECPWCQAEERRRGEHRPPHVQLN